MSDGAWTPFGLPRLSKKGGLGGVCRQLGAHLAAVDARLDEEMKRINALLATRSNTTDDNQRWTDWAARSSAAYADAHVFMRQYLEWIEEETKKELEEPLQ